MVLQFKGSNFFRQRLICATISGRPIRIDDIRPPHGLQEHEASLLRLLDKLTKGSVIQVNETGTSLVYKPGVIAGGQFLQHECAKQRGLGYYLELIISLAPFAKKAVSIVLKGVTNHPKDVSVDTIRNCTLHLLKRFGLEDDPTLQVISRGAYPDGGGEIKFTCPIIRQRLSPIQLVDEGMVKRIRGIVYSTRIAPAFGTRTVNSARQVLNHFIPDVWLYTDHYTGKQSGLSPGYAIYLQAETDTGCRISVEYNADKGMVPEDVGKHGAYLLFEELKRGGCVDSTHQGLVFLLMSLTPEDVSKVRVGRLTEYSIQYLRHIHDFFGVTFKIAPDVANKTIVLSCVGSGYKNMARKSN